LDDRAYQQIYHVDQDMLFRALDLLPHVMLFQINA